ncbi:Proteinase (Secreted protein) [Paramicrosporidium saccamoebae]|uniref:Proteinase (Secreted protein) n=1 Tax=Paramicrosporidium saccamoebae TaxID=1246581 RepID=A0A2H9TJL4_9FUNG|nr:Proteinase (Secreted protein) [Paramicrosporidium saccamoebae]
MEAGLVVPHTRVALKWQPCSGSALPLAQCHAVTYSVPSAYSSPDIAITLYVEKFKTGSGKNNLHVIYLGGGPGSAANTNYSIVEKILGELPPGTTLYLPDHRGLGKSTPLDRLNRSDWQGSMREIIAQAPFPLEHMTLTNSALDVGVLAGLITNETKEAKVALLGVSYGAHLAYHSAALLPNIFESILLFGTPNVRKFAEAHTDAGLIQNCAADSHCSKMMDGRAESIRDDLQKILNPDLNECTKIFYKDWERPIKPEIAVYGVLLRLTDLLWGTSSIPETNTLHSSQLAFAFIRVTAQCKSPETYQDKVLTPLSPYFQTFESAVLSEGGNTRHDFSRLVNSLILLDKMFDFKVGQPPALPKTTTGLVPTSISVSHYWRDFDVLKDVIAKMEKSKSVLLKSNKTKVFMVHGEVDLNTIIGPAQKLYNETESSKRFLRYRNRGHTGLSGPCRPHILREAFLNSDPALTDRCLADQNARPLDWTFSDTPFVEIWGVTSWTTFHASPTFMILVLTATVLFFAALVALLRARKKIESA